MATSSDFLNIAVGVFFAVLVVAAVYLFMRAARVLDEFYEMLSEAKQASRNARMITERGREAVDAVSGFLRMLFGERTQHRKKKKK